MKEHRFKEILQGLEIKINLRKYPDSIFFFKEDDFYFEYDFKNKNFWVSYDKVWRVFENEYSMKFSEIQSFIKTQVEQGFKLEGITPQFLSGLHPVQVEQCFKLEGVTPRRVLLRNIVMVEQDFRTK